MTGLSVRGLGVGPAAEIIAAAGEACDVRDAGGRVLSVRRLAALDRLRLFKAIGPLLAQNAPYLGMAMLAVSVTAVDGVPVPSPATEAQVEALVRRLGDEGIGAVAEVLAVTHAPALERVTQGN